MIARLDSRDVEKGEQPHPWFFAALARPAEAESPFTVIELKDLPNFRLSYPSLLISYVRKRAHSSFFLLLPSGSGPLGRADSQVCPYRRRDLTIENRIAPSPLVVPGNTKKGATAGRALQQLGCVGLATLPFAAYYVIRSASAHRINRQPLLEFLPEGVRGNPAFCKKRVPPHSSFPSLPPAGSRWPSRGPFSLKASSRAFPLSSMSPYLQYSVIHHQANG